MSRNIKIMFLFIALSQCKNLFSDSFYDCFVFKKSAKNESCGLKWSVQPIKSTPECIEILKSAGGFENEICTKELYISIKAFDGNIEFIEEMDLSFRDGAFRGKYHPETEFLGYSINWMKGKRNPVSLIERPAKGFILGEEFVFEFYEDWRNEINIKQPNTKMSITKLTPNQNKNLLKTYLNSKEAVISLSSSYSWGESSTHQISQKLKYLREENLASCNITIKVSRLLRNFKECQANLFICVDISSSLFQKEMASKINFHSGANTDRMDVLESLLIFAMRNFSPKANVSIVFYASEVVETLTTNGTNFDKDFLLLLRETMSFEMKHDTAELTNCIEKHKENGLTPKDTLIIFTEELKQHKTLLQVNGYGQKKVLFIMNTTKDSKTVNGFDLRGGIKLMNYEEIYKALDRHSNFVTQMCNGSSIGAWQVFYLMIAFYSLVVLSVVFCFFVIFFCLDRGYEEEIPMNLMRDNSDNYQKEIEIDNAMITIL